MTHDSRGFTGVQLMLALAVIACLMLAPVLMARHIQDSRIGASRARVDALAGQLRGVTMPRGAVLAGPGNPPAETRDHRWLAGTTTPLRVAGTEADAWGNQLLVNAGASSAIWVLSAGPNGVIDTPFDGASQPAGDDIAARIR